MRGYEWWTKIYEAVAPFLKRSAAAWGAQELQKANNAVLRRKELHERAEDMQWVERSETNWPASVTITRLCASSLTGCGCTGNCHKPIPKELAIEVLEQAIADLKGDAK